MVRIVSCLKVKPAMPWFFLAAGMNVLGAALALLQAFWLVRIVNAVFISKVFDDVAIWAVFLALAMAARAAAQWLGEVAAANFAARVKLAVREKLLKHIYALGPVYVKRLQSGEMTGLLTTGIDSLDAYLSKYLPQIVVTGVTPLLIIVAIVRIDWLSGILLLLTAPFVPVFLVLIGRWAENSQKKQWQLMSRLSGHFLDVLQGIVTLKLFGRSREQTDIIRRLCRQANEGALAVLKIAFLSSFMVELIATISTAIVAVIVGLRLLQGELAFEQALFVLLLVPEFYLPLRAYGVSYHAGLSGAEASRHIQALLDIEGTVRPGMKLVETNAAGVGIAFQDVWFQYNDRTSDALTGVSFSIAAGESTIASLLAGFIAPSSGIICMDGNAHGNPAAVTYLPQYSYVFAGTIADNIRIGRSSCTQEDIEQAAIQAEFHHTVLDMPEGYQTVVGENGYGLSSGEKQRLAIARAFLRDTPVVILDEPTSALDAPTEASIRQACERLFKGKTVLIIAHRLYSVLNTDRIIVLEAGRIVEEGRPSQLMGQRGIFYKMAAYDGEMRI